MRTEIVICKADNSVKCAVSNYTVYRYYNDDEGYTLEHLSETIGHANTFEEAVMLKAEAEKLKKDNNPSSVDYSYYLERVIISAFDEIKDDINHPLYSKLYNAVAVIKE